MRGIATGANEFFFLTQKQVNDLKLPQSFFKRAIGRTRDVPDNIITQKELAELEKKGRPTLLLYIDEPKKELPESLLDYIQKGEKLKLNNRSLLKLRKPWYKTEKRKVPELLFAYLGRRYSRFIKNEAGVLNLHCLHCVYTHSKEPERINNLWKVLNHPDTLKNLKYVSKSYGSGALKAEPQNLKNLIIPEGLVKMYSLEPKRKMIDNRLF